MNSVTNTILAEICASGSVSDVAVKFPALRASLEKFGIDYCCGGKIPFTQAVAEENLSLDAVVAELSEVLAASGSEVGGAVRVDWAQASGSELVDHILATHHPFTREALRRIDILLGRVQIAHAEEHGAMLEPLRVEFDKLDAELMAHMPEEEELIFPAVKLIDAFLTGTGPRPTEKTNLEAAINNGIAQHEEAGRLLKSMRSLTAGYEKPADGCPTFYALFDAMEELESDLHNHIHLENNILFPRSVRQEAILNSLG